MAQCNGLPSHGGLQLRQFPLSRSSRRLLLQLSPLRLRELGLQLLHSAHASRVRERPVPCAAPQMERLCIEQPPRCDTTHVFRGPMVGPTCSRASVHTTLSLLRLRAFVGRTGQHSSSLGPRLPLTCDRRPRARRWPPDFVMRSVRAVPTVRRGQTATWRCGGLGWPPLYLVYLAAGWP